MKKKKEAVMPTKKASKKSPSFKTIPAGTTVTWHYRSAIGHGTVSGVHKHGTTAANTMYSVKEHDHHPGEPSIVHHSGKALTVTAKN
jgi:plastocyanin